MIDRGGRIRVERADESGSPEWSNKQEIKAREHFGDKIINPIPLDSASSSSTGRMLKNLIKFFSFVATAVALFFGYLQVESRVDGIVSQFFNQAKLIFSNRNGEH